MSNVNPFSKYDDMGAYHWEECDPASGLRYNPPLIARYQVIVNRFIGVQRALDIGCGDGYLMSRLSPRCGAIVGLEADRAGVGIASSRLRGFVNARVVQASCFEMPFRGQTFDAISFADVIEHLETPESCLREAARVLTDDGRLLITTPRRLPGRPLGWNHVREYVGDDLGQILGEHFQEVTVGYYAPLLWWRLYSTRIGWRLIKRIARGRFNPFVREGGEATRFAQILAVCSRPRR